MKSTFSVAVLKNLESKHNKIQQKNPFLFPDLQETADTTVVLVFMKILKSNLGRRKMEIFLFSGENALFMTGPV